MRPDPGRRPKARQPRRGDGERSDVPGAETLFVGVDVNPAVVATARARARARGLARVSFVAGDLREVELDDAFDAVVGRFVLMYQADSAASLRAVLRAVRDGGLAVFHEADLAPG